MKNDLVLVVLYNEEAIDELDDTCVVDLSKYDEGWDFKVKYFRTSAERYAYTTALDEHNHFLPPYAIAFDNEVKGYNFNL